MNHSEPVAEEYFKEIIDESTNTFNPQKNKQKGTKIFEKRQDCIYDALNADHPGSQILKLT